MNSALLKNSNRLQRLLRFLSDGQWRSTKEIAEGANVMAVSAACAEIRDNGIPVACRHRKGKRSIWEYKIGGIGVDPSVDHPDLTEEDIATLPANFKTLVSAVGGDQAVDLCMKFAGRSVYFPKLDVAFRNARDRKIRAQRNSGSSYGELISKYKLTEKSIRVILKNGSAGEAHG